MKILIVKTSSLGDIIQTLAVLKDLHLRFSDVSVDWVVEESFSSLILSLPLVRKVIAPPMRELKKDPFSKDLWKKFKESVRQLRQERYDCVFDLQGNCKSAFWTFLSRSRTKVGFALKVCREWPNALSTNTRFFVPKEMNIQEQYLSIVQQYFSKTGDLYSKVDSLDFLSRSQEGISFRIEEKDQAIIDSIIEEKRKDLYVMVCPSAQWKNKQLSLKTWIDFLNCCAKKYSMQFLLIWGSLEERGFCEQIHAACPHSSVLDRRLSIPVWQTLMCAMDLVIALDSSALHLCATTKTPSFSIFGPTSSSVFKPLGEKHLAVQGSCPYGKTFLKQCPILRSCPTGACMKEISSKTLLQAFHAWIGEHLAIR